MPLKELRQLNFEEVYNYHLMVISTLKSIIMQCLRSHEEKRNNIKDIDMQPMTMELDQLNWFLFNLKIRYIDKKRKTTLENYQLISQTTIQLILRFPKWVFQECLNVQWG
jgi:hypothetical protein